ncbi:MAG: DUF4158 domain-containing protein [Novosphingobium sp.]
MVRKPQLTLMRHPGFGFTLEVGAPGHLVAFMAEQIDVSASAFDTYAARPATASVHARQAGGALGLRGPTNADLPLLIEAGTKAAWSTGRGLPIVVGIMEALRASSITLPSPSVIERAGMRDAPALGNALTTRCSRAYPSRAWPSSTPRWPSIRKPV